VQLAAVRLLPFVIFAIYVVGYVRAFRGGLAGGGRSEARRRGWQLRATSWVVLGLTIAAVGAVDGSIRLLMIGAGVIAAGLAATWHYVWRLGPPG
jgi:hypothetical protein